MTKDTQKKTYYSVPFFYKITLLLLWFLTGLGVLLVLSWYAYSAPIKVLLLAFPTITLVLHQTLCNISFALESRYHYFIQLLGAILISLSFDLFKLNQIDQIQYAASLFISILVYTQINTQNLSSILNNQKPEKLRYKLLLFIILISILSIAFYFRIKGSLIRSYWMDEAITVMVAKNFSEMYKLVLDGGNAYTGYMLHTSSMGLLFKLFGASYLTSRIISVISSLALIAAIFHYAKKYLNFKVALFSTVVISFSLFDLSWATQARHYELYALLFFLFSFAFFELIDSRTFSKKKLLQVIILFILTILVNGASIFILSICCLIFIILHRRELVSLAFLKAKQLIVSKYGVFYIVGFIVCLSGIIWYELPTLKNIGTILKLENNFVYYAEFISALHPILTLLFIPGFIFLFTTSKLAHIKNLVISFLIIPFVILSTLNIYPTSPYQRYIFNLYPFFIIVISTAAAIGVHRLRKENIVLLVILSSIIGFAIFRSYETIVIFPRTEYPVSVFSSPYPQYELGFEHIKANFRSGDILVTTRAAIPSAYDMELDYLLSPKIGSKEYERVKNALLIDEAEYPKERFSKNGIFIFGKTELEKVVAEHERGWILWDNDLGDNLDPETFEYLNFYFTQIKIDGVNPGVMKIYFWDKNL